MSRSARIHTSCDAVKFSPRIVLACDIVRIPHSLTSNGLCLLVRDAGVHVEPVPNRTAHTTERWPLYAVAHFAVGCNLLQLDRRGWWHVVSLHPCPTETNCVPNFMHGDFHERTRYARLHNGTTSIGALSIRLAFHSSPAFRYWWQKHKTGVRDRQVVARQIGERVGTPNIE